MKIKFIITVCFVFSLIHSGLFAQRDKKDCISHPVGSSLSSKVPTDTIGLLNFNAGTPTLYSYVDGGYSFGTNVLSDRAFAQVYNVTTSYIVEGVALWFGAKQQIGTADTLNVIIYKLIGPGTDTSGMVNNAPDSTEHLLQITTDLVDTTGLTFINFTNPYIAYVDYAVGIDLSKIEDDTLGLVTTEDGDADSTQLSWNKWSDNTWHTVLEPVNWGMDLDLGIFMIVDQSTANIFGNYFIDGIKLSQNQPNPVSGSTLIQYEIENASDVTFEIYDITGKLVITYKEGMQIAGNHSIVLESDKLNPGIYYYSLKADNHRLTKKMVVGK